MKLYFPNHINPSIMKKLLILIAATYTFSSCSNYYKAITTSAPVAAARIDELSNDNRYFILREGSQAFAMKDITFSADRNSLKCTLEDVPDEHKLHLTKGNYGNMKYKEATVSAQDNETMVLYEAHLYIAPGVTATPGPFTLALDKVQKLEVLEKDKEKTRRSHTKGAIIGIGASVLVVAGIAAIAVGSSLNSMHF